VIQKNKEIRLRDMAKNYCTFVPSKGNKLFRRLKNEFGYPTARSVFLRAINPNFIKDYEGTLSLDAEGVPTYESLMANDFIRKFIGSHRMAWSLSKNYSPVEDTRDNYGNLLETAYQFNNTHPQRDSVIATVEQTEDGKITVLIQPKTQKAVRRFQDQYSTQKLNERLASIFRPLGVTVGTLSQAEVDAGRVGVTDFSVARDLANGFVSLIKVANNMEGAMALSEEFSHTIVGIFRKDPLVDRAINVLANNEEALRQLLGDDYEDTVAFYDGDMLLVAEEAAGHLLQKNLLHEENIKEMPTPSLFRRMINWIINKFKGYNINDVQDAIDQADAIMSSIAQDVLKGTRTITREDIKASQRNARFNALSDKIDRNIDILKEAAKTEVKRYKISKAEDLKDTAETLVDNILEYTTPQADTALGLFNYAKYALKELKHLEDIFGVLDQMSPEGRFTFLRNVRMYIQSYGPFISAMNKAMIEDEKDDDNMFLRDFGDIEVEGERISLKDVITELNSMTESLTVRFSEVAMPAFAEFLKPFLGEEIIVPFGKYAGSKMSVESLLKEAERDISFMDRWLDSMADSSDYLLQLFDAAVKEAKDKARLQTMDDIRVIQLFRERAESMGITDFSWMFEVDDEGNKSGNYISEINYAQFNKELKEFEAQLEEKYGKNPSGEEAILKIAERDEWLEEHSTSIFGTPLPDPVKYKNAAYANLTDNQRTILREFLALKARFDSKLPKNRVARNKAIQIRKSGSQRLMESITSPSTLYENLKETVAASILDREDDDQIFGTTKVKSGLTDFEGNEFMTLPVLYTNRLANPNEISEDVVGSLMAYAYMANQYEEMDKIVDPLEIGRALVTDPKVRRVRKTRGGSRLAEKFSALDIEVVNKVFLSRSNIEDKLNDFFESQIYGKYLKDEGTFNVLGTPVNVNKFVSLLLKGSSLAQLGFNWLANIANVATGLGMQNIEAAAGQFYTPKELFAADNEYRKAIPAMMAELGSRSKTNKMDLFFELFDVKQDFGKNVKHSQKKSWLERLFGAEIAFLGQDAGDHWLYGRTAIAMALKERVLLNGREMSLWEALEVEGVNGSDTIKQLNYRDITDLEGNPFDVGAFARKIAHVNQTCFGIYNDDDANAANRVAAGRLLQQYRKWMKIQYNKRFQAVQRNKATESWEEGYYRTMGRMLNQWLRGGVQLAEQWDNMEPEEKANIRRALTEMVQFFAVWVLANWIEWPDDKKRPYALKLAEYSSKRLAHELGGLAPSTVMPQELLKTVKSPVPIVSVIQNGFNLINSAIDPTDWVNEISSGPYKGMSNLEKNFIKAPLPIVAQYRQIDKFIGDLDSSITYYARPN
jgi:hypothetical protein